MFYECLKPVGHSIDGDIEYCSRRLEDITGRVLEAGVGTGRMLIPLIKKGLTIDGIDSSPEMLEQCRINLKNMNAPLPYMNRTSPRAPSPIAMKP